MRDRLKSEECSKYLRAVADADRLKIIQCLQAGPRTVGEISRTVHSVLANVSHHLGLLKAAGLVTSRKKGRFVVYALDPNVVHRAANSALNVLDFGCCRLELGSATG